MKIVFRVDSSFSIGTGHVMRCLTLAKECRAKGALVVFICRDLLGNTSSRLIENQFDVKMLPLSDELIPMLWESDALETSAILNELGRLDWLVVDHYNFDHEWHSRMRPYVNNIFVIDDLVNRKYDCDILLDQTYGRTAVGYKDLVPADADLLLGSQFALLKPEFALAHQKSWSDKKKASETVNILVAIGGMGNEKLFDMILGATGVLRDHKIKLHFMLSAKSPYVESLKEATDKFNLAVQFHIDIDNVAELMSDMDFAICAGGTTVWECCAVGLPMLILTFADNQKFVAKSLFEAGAAEYLGTTDEISSDDFGRAFGKFLVSTDLEKMRSKAKCLCDAKGAVRVANSLVKFNQKACL